jgi:hypothetical protein
MSETFTTRGLHKMTAIIEDFIPIFYISTQLSIQ